MLHSLAFGSRRTRREREGPCQGDGTV